MAGGSRAFGAALALLLCATSERNQVERFKSKEQREGLGLGQRPRVLTLGGAAAAAAACAADMQLAPGHRSCHLPSLPPLSLYAGCLACSSVSYSDGKGTVVSARNMGAPGRGVRPLPAPGQLRCAPLCLPNRQGLAGQGMAASSYAPSPH